MTLLLIFLVCVLTCIGQLCQKRAVHNWAGLTLRWTRKLRDPWLLSGLLAMGAGLLLWLLVLRVVPLNRAYPMLSLNFVLVAVASRIWFGEPGRARDWWGIACIVLGVALIGARL
ncbi:MAG: 4-amino-4-deoxy-L-arabinose-phospho-UDP flippase [Porticoccaceae bacterium]|nr:MAG: 4-amino-4-deoxy-L-arabinose-phospho-UDP flippase [Porticoccaceae bacterium]